MDLNISQHGSSAGNKLHRCFYAIRFGDEVVDYLDSIISALKSHGADVGWVPPKNIHLTLRFLGEVTGQQLEAAIGMTELDESYRGFTVRARGLGAFPLLRAPRVLWAGMELETQSYLDRLLRLQGTTEQWARTIGVPPENRPYKPHITLGRVHRASDRLRELMDDVITRECESPLTPISNIVLIRSMLSSGRSAYEEVARWELI